MAQPSGYEGYEAHILAGGFHEARRAKIIGEANRAAEEASALPTPVEHEDQNTASGFFTFVEDSSGRATRCPIRLDGRVVLPGRERVGRDQEA